MGTSPAWGQLTRWVLGSFSATLPRVLQPGAEGAFLRPVIRPWRCVWPSLWLAEEPPLFSGRVEHVPLSLRGVLPLARQRDTEVYPVTSALGAASQGRSSRVAQRPIQGRTPCQVPLHPHGHHPSPWPIPSHWMTMAASQGLLVQKRPNTLLIFSINRTLSWSGVPICAPEGLHFPASLAARKSHVPEFWRRVARQKLWGGSSVGRPFQNIWFC